MAKKDLPSPEVLRQLLRYEPYTGKLFWRERGPEWFSEERRMRAWNTRCSGKPALTSRHGEGYLCGPVLNRLLLAHRVAVVIQTGAWPTEDVDHINGDRSDNRWSNLRAVSRATNAKNAARSKSNTSGHTGVWFSDQNRRWVAEIKVDGAKHSLGCFSTKGEAAAARKAAEERFGFHKNHGRV